MMAVGSVLIVSWFIATAHACEPSQLTGCSDFNFAASTPGTWKGVDFTGVDLENSNFTAVDLTGATFDRANLTNTVFSNAVLARTSFKGSNIDRTDFNFAQFDCVDFSGADITAGNFGPDQNFTDQVCRSRFQGTTLLARTINPNEWGCVDFSDAVFLNLSPSTVRFKDQDLSNAVLSGQSLANFDFSGANLRNVDLTGANLNGAVFDGAFLGGVVFENASIQGASFKGADFAPNSSGGPDSGSCSSSSTATPANLSGSDLSSSDFSPGSSIYYPCDLTSSIETTKLNSVTFSGARLIGTDFTGADLSSAVFSAGTTGPAAYVLSSVFNDANLLDVDISGVSLKSSSFLCAQFGSSKATGTTLNQTDFTDANLGKATFSNISLQSVDFSGAGLQGAVFQTNVRLESSTGDSRLNNFQCAQTGGADFSGLRELAAGTSFIGAVMPVAADCCKDACGKTVCGTVSGTSKNYGATVPPGSMNGSQLTVEVPCPDGENSGDCNLMPNKWSIPNWQMHSCTGASSGIVWSAPTQCTGSPAPTVGFFDKNLQACVESTLGTPGVPVTRSAASQLKALKCPSMEIRSLAGIDQLSALIQLDVSGNVIDQNGIAVDWPSGLQDIDLGDNSVANLDLRALESLVRLNASDNRLTEVDLSAQAKLRYLDLSGNQLTSFPLQSLVYLYTADLSFNPGLRAVSSSGTPNLDDLTTLDTLDLRTTALTTIGAIDTIAYSKKDNLKGKLRALYLQGDSSFDCSSLKLDRSYPAFLSSGCVGASGVNPHPGGD